MKTYIISFYQQEISDDELVAFLESRKEVLNLMMSLPNTVFIASDHNASALARLIEKKFPKAFFIVAEYVPYNSDGSLFGEMWDFLNKPKLIRKARKSVSTKGRKGTAKSASKK